MTQSGDPKAKRLLKMLFLLQSGRQYDISRLAKEMAVSRRTIFRDVATLKAVGVPVRFDDGTHSLVVHSAELGQPPVAFNDLALLMLGALSSTRAELPAASDEMRQAICRLAGRLDVGLRGQASELMSHIVVSSADASSASTPRADVVVAVATSLSTSRLVYVIVDDPHRHVEWRFKFAPYQLRMQSAGWTALGATNLHEKPCLVDLSHVLRTSMTEEPYSIPANLPQDEDLERL